MERERGLDGLGEEGRPPVWNMKDGMSRWMGVWV